MSYLSSRRVFKRAKSFTGIALTLLMVFQTLGPGVFALKTAHAASTVFSDSFGTGNTDSTFNESPSWNEGGNSGNNADEDAVKRAAGSGNDSASPEGGRFAAIYGENGWICRQIDATGFYGLLLSYYWRGDSDANPDSGNNDHGFVEYRTTGGLEACNSNPNSWTPLKDHNLKNTDANWTLQPAFALDSELDNSKFLLRFRADTTVGGNNANDREDFRVDGVLIQGEKPQLELFFSCKVEGDGGGSVWFVKNHSGSDIDFDWKILPNADSGSSTADYSNPFHDTTFKASAQGTAEITWQQGNKTFTDQESMGDRICKGRLTVVKEVVGGDAKVGDFNLYVDGNSVTSGQETEVTAEYPNVHTITEDNLPNYTASFSSNCANGEITVGFEENETCTITNTYEAPPLPDGEALIVATKVVCDAEDYLPNWGFPGGLNIDADTATDWVAQSNGHCHLESGWQFEWAYPGATDAGQDFVGPAGGPWTTFGLTNDEGVATTTVDLSNDPSHLWVREVLKSGYIPFGGQAYDNLPGSDVSAEIYCHTDVLNYDNFDRVDGVTAGNTYYCVAFNVPETIPAQCEPGVELIKNGSFEDPVVTDGAGWDIFDSGTSGLEWVANWMRTGGEERPDTASLELHAGVNSWAPSAGSQYAELDGDWGGPGHGGNEDASTYIYQDISTVPGETYTLSFDFSPRPDTGASNNVLGVSWNGTDFPLTPLSGGNATNQTTWTNHVFGFEATSTLTRIQFEDRGTGDSLGTFLDNVSLKCEEPEKCEETSGSIVSDDSVVVTYIDVNGATSTPNTNAEEVSVVAQIQSLGANVWDADVGDANASWIWSEDPYDQDWEVDKWVTFTKTFTVDGEAQSSSLKIAADNEYEVWVNGVLVNSDFSEDNHSVADGSFDVAAHLIDGNNTLEVRVKNIGLPGNNQENNPGGLLFALSWTAKDCDPDDGGDPDPEEARVTIAKYVDGELASTQVVGGEDFVIDYSISGLKGNVAGQTVLTGDSPTDSFNAWIGDTVNITEFTSDHSQQYDEVPLGGQCSEGLYRLVGYSFGSNQTEAENALIDNDTGFSNGGLIGNLYVIVHNETCLPPPCVEGETWAATVEDYAQGKRKNGSDVLLSRSNPSNVLGTPDGNGGANTGFFSLGEDGTITVEFDHYVDNVDGDDLSFHEITNGRDSYPEEKAFVEVSQNGTDWEDVGTVSSKDGTVSYLDFDSTGFDWIRYVRITDTTDFSLHSNDADGYDLDAVDATWGLCEEPKGDGGGDPDPNPTTSEHLTVVTGDTSAGENLPGWLFNRDLSTQSPFEFNTDAASIGTGSLFVEPITNTINGNSDKFIGELFLLTPLAGVGSISYDFQIGAPDSTVEEQFYMSVYANFGESAGTKFYDCRYNVVPALGSTGVFTTVTFDPTQTYPVTTHGTSPYVCPSSPADMDTLSSGSTIRVIALNVGDTSGSDTGVSGYLDKVVTVITTGLNTHTETYDLEPTPITPTITSTGGGTGGGSRSGGNGPVSFIAGASTGDPEVLGAAIDLPGLPNTGNGENSQFAATFLALIVSLLALNYFGLKALKRG